MQIVQEATTGWCRSDMNEEIRTACLSSLARLFETSDDLGSAIWGGLDIVLFVDSLWIFNYQKLWNDHEKDLKDRRRLCTGELMTKTALKLANLFWFSIEIFNSKAPSMFKFVNYLTFAHNASPHRSSIQSAVYLWWARSETGNRQFVCPQNLAATRIRYPSKNEKSSWDSQALPKPT